MYGQHGLNVYELKKLNMMYIFIYISFVSAIIFS